MPNSTVAKRASDPRSGHIDVEAHSLAVRQVLKLFELRILPGNRGFFAVFAVSAGN
jgi:hypothetical protein